MEDNSYEGPPLKKICLSLEDNEPVSTLEVNISDASSSQPVSLGYSLLCWKSLCICLQCRMNYQGGLDVRIYLLRCSVYHGTC